MRLESVRALKAQLLAQTIRPAHLPNKVARRFIAEVGGEQPLPTPALALGIAPRRDGPGYALAVRMFDHSNDTRRLAFHAIRASRGEANVAYVGHVQAPRTVPAGAGYRARVRPIVPGYSIAHHQVTVGTIGAFVTRGGYIHMLSNNHVLANTNRARRGDHVLQPGPADGGRARDTVGWFHFARRIAPAGNLIDAAVAVMWDKIDYEPIYDGRYLAGIEHDVDVGDHVWKVGRTTNRTNGRVTAFDVDNVDVDYSDAGDGSLVYSFDGQIEIMAPRGRLFSEGGDSGSLILNAEDRAVGLLFAGSDDTGVTYANPIRPVLQGLEARLLRA